MHIFWKSPASFLCGRISNQPARRGLQDMYIPIRFLCGLCLPDLKIIQAGEKLCISFAVIFYRKTR